MRNKIEKKRSSDNHFLELMTLGPWKQIKNKEGDCGLKLLHSKVFMEKAALLQFSCVVVTPYAHSRTLCHASIEWRFQSEKCGSQALLPVY